ncbi:MAG: ABC transporter permease [Dehalococcoidia bacterium]
MQAEQALTRPQVRGRSPWVQVAHRFLRRKVGVISLAVIVVLYLSGVLAPWVAPYSYREQNLEQALQGPSLRHPFGTDRLGRDLFSRTIFAVRTTVIVTIAAVVTGGIIIGVVLGLISGYFGRLADAVIMRVGEVFLAFPGLLLVLLIAATVKPRVLDWVRAFEDATGIEGIVRVGIVDYVVVFGAIAAYGWVGMARLVRGQVLQLKESQFIESAIAVGASQWRILLVHILPNLLSPIVVVVSMGMGAAAGSEVVLSWLGIGIQPPTPSLGVMIFENGNISVLRTYPHLVLFPVGIVAIIIFAFNLLGDALNDAINPRIH